VWLPLVKGDRRKQSQAHAVRSKTTIHINLGRSGQAAGVGLVRPSRHHDTEHNYVPARCRMGLRPAGSQGFISREFVLCLASFEDGGTQREAFSGRMVAAGRRAMSRMDGNP
jgi:hypothetical protein